MLEKLRPYQNWLEVAIKSWSTRLMAFAMIPGVWDLLAAQVPNMIPVEFPYAKTITSLLVMAAFFAKLVPQNVPKVPPEPKE